jgi:hypothetical protein
MRRAVVVVAAVGVAVAQSPSRPALGGDPDLVPAPLAAPLPPRPAEDAASRAVLAGDSAPPRDYALEGAVEARAAAKTLAPPGNPSREERVGTTALVFVAAAVCLLGAFAARVLRARPR